ncbi:MAG: YciI family protein [Caldilineaceae bacterium]
MQYLLLLYQDEQQLKNMFADGHKLWSEMHHVGTELLRASGRLLGGAQLQAADPVATLSIQHDQVMLTADPSAGVTGQLSAFYFIEAYDLNDAIQVAARLPQARYGSIEVRPVAGSASRAVGQ